MRCQCRIGKVDSVIAFDQLGEVSSILRVTPNVPSGVVVAEGIWWLKHCPGSRSVNALTSQRLADQGEGSTFYDNTVDVRSEGNELRALCRELGPWQKGVGSKVI